MHISIIGGGAWGTTLAQVLIDNHHHVKIYDVKQDNVDKINQKKTSFFLILSYLIKYMQQQI